jgi:hypothetical protein
VNLKSSFNQAWGLFLSKLSIEIKSLFLNKLIMKAALILMFLILPTLSFSQMVNNVPMKDIDAEYVEFSVGGRGFMQTARYIYLD